jgi:hypothetical protein
MTVSANPLSPARLSQRIKTQHRFLDSISSLSVLEGEDFAPPDQFDTSPDKAGDGFYKS